MHTKHTLTKLAPALLSAALWVTGLAAPLPDRADRAALDAAAASAALLITGRITGSRLREMRRAHAAERERLLFAIETLSRQPRDGGEPEELAPVLPIRSTA